VHRAPGAGRDVVDDIDGQSRTTTASGSRGSTDQARAWVNLRGECREKGGKIEGGKKKKKKKKKKNEKKKKKKKKRKNEKNLARCKHEKIERMGSPPFHNPTPPMTFFFALFSFSFSFCSFPVFSPTYSLAAVASQFLPPPADDMSTASSAGATSSVAIASHVASAADLPPVRPPTRTSPVEGARGRGIADGEALSDRVRQLDGVCDT
jgi:hypothetical protein